MTDCTGVWSGPDRWSCDKARYCQNRNNVQYAACLFSCICLPAMLFYLFLYISAFFFPATLAPSPFLHPLHLNSPLFQYSFPAGGGLSLSSISPSPPFLSLSHLVRQLWLARVQWGGKVWREDEEKEEEGWGGWVLRRLSIAKPRAQ